MDVLNKLAEEAQDIESSAEADALALESFATDGVMDIPNKKGTGRLANEYMKVAEKAISTANSQVLEKCLDILLCVTQHIPKETRCPLALLFAKVCVISTPFQAALLNLTSM